MNIATLGPKATDSYKATIDYSRKTFSNYKILCYNSFEKLFNIIKEKKSNIDFIVMPMGYCNRKGKEFSSWVDFHFYYLEYMEVKDVFYSQTKEMILIENIDYKKEGIVLQSATFQLARKVLNLSESQYFFVPSKPLALEFFEKEGYHYTICSKDDFINKVKNQDIEYRVVNKFNPTMVWIVYKVRK